MTAEQKHPAAIACRYGCLPAPRPVQLPSGSIEIEVPRTCGFCRHWRQSIPECYENPARLNIDGDPALHITTPGCRLWAMK